MKGEEPAKETGNLLAMEEETQNNSRVETTPTPELKRHEIDRVEQKEVI